MNETLRLAVRHETTYAFDGPATWGLHQLRLRPKEHASQRTHHWAVRIDGGREEAAFEDQHRNAVSLVSLDAGTDRLHVVAEGEVEITDTHGVLGPQGGYAPLWLFARRTARTEPGPAVAALIAALPPQNSPLMRLHDLMAAVAEAIAWTPGASDVDWTAETALAEGKGVCQDQAHAFIACARELGHPARYVSGYLHMPDRDRQEAMHAWAEAWVPDLGWVGFDVANRICPDARYVRVATGLDYAEATPLFGRRIGPGGAHLTVTVEVRALP